MDHAHLPNDERLLTPAIAYDEISHSTHHCPQEDESKHQMAEAEEPHTYKEIPKGIHSTCKQDQ